MSSARVSGFRRLLEAKLTELSATDSNRGEIVIADGGDEIDRQQQQLNREIAVFHLERQSHFLRSIQEALDRITDGTYGTCLRCDEPIPEKRLVALPWAEYCICCQETVDRLPTNNMAEDGRHKVYTVE